MKIDFDPRVLSDSLHFIILLPFLGALVNGLFGRRLGKGNVALIACGAVGTSAVLSAMVLLPMAFPNAFVITRPIFAVTETLGVWFKSGNMTVNAGLLADHLSAVLMLVVTGVGFLIHVYSTKYMEDDEGFWKFMAYLNLFIGFMLILVMGDNLVVMFVGWEGVGLCSYLLIGFWYEDEAKAYAGRKAFVTNRIGDFGFVLGMFTLFALVQAALPETRLWSVDFRTLADLARTIGGRLDQPVGGGVLATMGMTYGQGVTLACLLLFVGATGKSAQLPLYVWLPDAMAGPTPVSALIHAATMVTAGVYMIARLSFLFALSPTAMAVVTLVGTATALFAAVMGFAQNDIKKVLAYSTVSQLGFMVIGVGIGAYWQGVFHLVTHAFFKACLFLGAGSVILGCHHEQDIRRMGGLRKRMPTTALTFAIACIAITGVIPFSGFWSKDGILHAAHTSHLHGFEWVGHVAYYVGTLTALFTAFYMFRLYFLTFEGAPRSEHAEHAHEQPASVTFPLWVLAVFSVVAAVWGIPWVTLPGTHEMIFENFTKPVFGAAYTTLGIHETSHEGLVVALLVALVVAWAGFGLAFWLYMRNGIERFKGFYEKGFGRGLYNVVANKFYVDEIYDYAILTPFKGISFLVWQLVDRFAIDKLAVEGAGKLALWAGSGLRFVQNGDVQRYAAVMAIAAALVVWGMLSF